MLPSCFSYNQKKGNIGTVCESEITIEQMYVEKLRMNYGVVTTVVKIT